MLMYIAFNAQHIERKLKRETNQNLYLTFFLFTSKNLFGCITTENEVCKVTHRNRLELNQNKYKIVETHCTSHKNTNY